MPKSDDTSRLTDPGYCIREAARLVVRMTEENWDLVRDAADELNILQAAIAHLVYLDTERADFQEKVMEIVFSAYLMGRGADETRRAPDWDAFREVITGLDLSGLPAPGRAS